MRRRTMEAMGMGLACCLCLGFGREKDLEGYSREACERC